jgi:hypothetical protein
MLERQRLEADVNATKTTRPEQIQEMMHKREVAIELIPDGAVKQKLLAQLSELRNLHSRLDTVRS